MNDILYLISAFLMFLLGIWFVDGCERLGRIGK